MNSRAHFIEIDLIESTYDMFSTKPDKKYEQWVLNELHSVNTVGYTYRAFFLLIREH